MMKVVKVFGWTQDSEAESGIWVVREDDLKHFDVVKELFKKYPVYVLRREHQDATVIVHSYLSQKHYKSITYVADEISSSYEYNIISNIVSAVEAFSSIDNQKLYFLVQEIGRMTGGRTRYDRLIHFFEVLHSIAIVMSEIYYASIYGCLTQKCWWLEMPNFNQHFQEILNKIDRLPEPFKSTINIVYHKFRSNLDALNKKRVEAIFKVVSAYCFSLSLHYINRNLFMNAYLSIHRSLDLFFTSAAITLNLVNVKRDFIVYYDVDAPKDGRKEGTNIFLTSTYFDYVAKKERLSNEDENAIIRINKKRNSLLLTHGVDSASSDEIKDAYLHALKIMKKDQEWKFFLDNCKLYVHLNTSEVLYDFLGLRSILTSYEFSEGN